MSNLVIVAIPDENDRVWKISSEKVPHLTVLHLGDLEQVANVDQITQFVEHAASQTLNRFYLPVDRRGELGEDKADVLFFKRRYDYRAVRDFRMQLLKDDNIRTAYDSSPQFDGPWMPHLTLGYPATPAKPDDTDRDFGFYDVSFNRIAVWLGDYDGPEFLLKDYWDEYEERETVPMDVAWSDQTDALLVAEFLESSFGITHHGVKGMKWGVRNDRQGRDRLNPEGYSVGGDVARAVGYGMVPIAGFGLVIPSYVRLGKRLGAASKERKADKDWHKGLSKDLNKAVEVNNLAADEINPKIPAFNADKRWKDAAGKDIDLNTNPAKMQEYNDAYAKEVMNPAFANAAIKVHGSESPSGRYKFEIKDASTGVLAVKDTKKVQHAVEDDADFVIEFDINRAQNGTIRGFTLPVDALAQSTIDGAEYLVHQGLMSIDDFLEHHGIKGMRWGVRKEDLTGVGNAAKSVGNKVGKAAVATGKFVGDVQFENKLSTLEGKQAVEYAIHSKAKQAFKRTDLPALKAKPEHQQAAKLKNRLLHPLDPGTKAYRKDAKEAYIKRLEEAANTMTNTSGTRQYTIRERGWELPAEGGALPRSKNYWDVSTREVKHADDLDTIISVEVTLDDDGWITDISPVSPEDAAAHSMQLGADFLAGLGISGEEIMHYGVKGMQWGVRKAPPEAVAPVTRVIVPHGAKRRTQIKAYGGENHTASPDAIKVAESKAKLKRSGTVALSNKELRELQERLNLERNVSQLVGPTNATERGRKFIKDLVGLNKQTNDAANTVLTTQNIYRRART